MKKPALKIFYFILAALLASACATHKMSRKSSFLFSQQAPGNRHGISEIYKPGEMKILNEPRPVLTEALELRQIITPLHGIKHADIITNKAGRQHKIKNKKPEGESCDTIVLIHGGQVTGKIEHIDESGIQYRKCDSRDASFYYVKLSDVKYIIYGNGLRQNMDMLRPVKKNKSGEAGHLFKLWLLALAATLLLVIIAAAAAAGASFIAGLLYLLAFLCGIAFLVYYVSWLLKLLK